MSADAWAITVLVVSFAVLVTLNVPIAFCMGISTLLGVLVAGDLPSFLIVAQRMATGIDSFALLAIPFFILSGLFMERGGIARRLIDFANVIVGRFRGGLALCQYPDLYAFWLNFRLSRRGGLLGRRLYDSRYEQDGLRPGLQRLRQRNRRNDGPAHPAKQRNDCLFTWRPAVWYQSRPFLSRASCRVSSSAWA